MKTGMTARGGIAALAAAALAVCSAAAADAAAQDGRGRFTPDRSVMSEAYWKIWNDGLQKEIDARIEKNRKADAAFPVSAPDGAEVLVEQCTHEFLFGAHIFNFNQLGTPERNRRYKELFGTLFNSATIPFFWRTLERNPGAPRFEERYEDTEEFWNKCENPNGQPHWRRPPVDPLVRFLKSRRVWIHGHPLVWGNDNWMNPSWLYECYCPESESVALQRASGASIPRSNLLDVPAGVNDVKWAEEWKAAWRKIFARLSEEEIARLAPTYIANIGRLYERRVKQIAERYGDFVDAWDVVNESATDFARFGGREAVRLRPFDKSWYGPMPADYAFKAFVWAGRYLPRSARFNLNDYKNDIHFANQAASLAKNGARIDTIGSQMHLFNSKECESIAKGEYSKTAMALVHPASLEKRFNLLSGIGRPILLSEVTISAPDDTPEGRMIQAIVLRDLYRWWFSYKDMRGITWWNVVDDCGAPGEPTTSGLFTRDMKPKTAYFAMDDLINREWKTRLSVKAKDGKAVFRGFRGAYRLKWRDAKGAVCVKYFTLR